MPIRIRRKRNWVRLCGHIAKDPSFNITAAGDEVCQFKVATLEGQIPVRTAGKTARRAVACTAGTEVEVVGAMLAQSAPEGRRGFSGIQAAAVRRIESKPNWTLRRVLRVFARCVATAFFLVTWPGGATTTATLALVIWASWNGWFIFANPQFPALKLRRVARWTALAVIVLGVIALLLR